jgi:succinate dehydrogenase/fumarate reductase-like Fe-S protein
MSTGLRIAGSRDATVKFRYDDLELEAVMGETVAAALLAAGKRGFAVNPADGSPRGLFCASGLCQECAVVIEGRIREACRVRVSEGLRVRSRR